MPLLGTLASPGGRSEPRHLASQHQAGLRAQATNIPYTAQPSPPPCVINLPTAPAHLTGRGSSLGRHLASTDHDAAAAIATLMGVGPTVINRGYWPMFAFSGFAFDGEILSFQNPDNMEDEVQVSEDGELSILGEPVPMDSRNHQNLEELFAEAVRLGQLLDQASDHLAELDADSQARLLRGDDTELDASLRAELKDQMERVREVLDTVRSRVPELSDLDWLLAE